MDPLDSLLEKLWEDYRQINPQAEAIHRLLEERGETVINDHIAFRTLNMPETGIEAMARVFLELGYSPGGEYAFEEKKLKAMHFEPPRPGAPKIFISELLLEKITHRVRNVFHKLAMQIPIGFTKREDFVVAGRPWKPITIETYETIRQESEYAAWLAVFGFRPNHFTVSVNHLKTFSNLKEFNECLKSQGFRLNNSGGEIKGSAAQGLEQSSTLAHPVKVEFADGTREVPGCYYEFAYRHPMKDGKEFPGFIAKSADKIFESTDNREM